MKTINVKVKITGGIAPVDINVITTNLDTNEIVKWKERMSFSRALELETGMYTIQVFGSNAASAKTEIEISGNFTTGPLPHGKRTTAKPFIPVLFYFEI